MGLNHDHSDHHDHDHSGQGKAFAIGISLNLIFVFVEAIYGYRAHSLALLADAGHNLSDVLGLALAWGASLLAHVKPNSKFSYGLKSSSIMAALFNAVLLLVATGGILVEAVKRFLNPGQVHADWVMIVAAIGILVNGITALLFVSGKNQDLNIRGAFLHMVSDAFVSLGVVIAGFLYLKTGLAWIDPVVSVVISLVIIFGTLRLFRESLELSLHAVPRGIDLVKVQDFLESVPEVKTVHDLHVWGMSTTDAALTCHLVMNDPDQFLKSGKLKNLIQALNEKFHIEHATIQLDRPEDVAVCVHH